MYSYNHHIILQIWWCDHDNDIFSEAVCACPLIDSPVCCQGNQYNNQCSADYAGFSDSQCTVGECPMFVPWNMITMLWWCRISKYMRCRSSRKGRLYIRNMWTRMSLHIWYIAVCCNGKTYGNKISAECAEEDLVDCEYGEWGYMWL